MLEEFPELSPVRKHEMTKFYLDELVEWKYAMTDKEWEFVRGIKYDYDFLMMFVPTDKQLSWLKDLYERYSE